MATKTKNSKSTKPATTIKNVLPGGTASPAGEHRVVSTPHVNPVTAVNATAPVLPATTVEVDPNLKMESPIFDNLYAVKLVGDFLDGAKDQTKGLMLESKTKTGHGEFGCGTISAGGPTNTVDISKFLKMVRAAKIDDKKLAEMISVSATGMAKHFGQSEIAGCLQPGPAKSPSLTISIIKGATPPSPIEAVEYLKELVILTQKQKDATTAKKA